MTQFRTTGCFKSRTALLAVSVAVAFLSMGECTASCGDYVYSRFRAPVQMSHGDTPQTTAMDSQNQIVDAELARLMDEDVRQGPTPTLPILPCSGPGCRRSPSQSLPIAPLASVGGGSVDRLLHGAWAIELPRDVSRRRVFKSSARALRGFPLLIEVPPERAG